jgi:hypothetical protein
MEVVDFLIEHPSIKWTPQEFIDTLAKPVPRLYSISSSLKAHPIKCISPSTWCITKAADACAKAFAQFFLAERAENAPVAVSERVEVLASRRQQHADRHGRQETQENQT